MDNNKKLIDSLIQALELAPDNSALRESLADVYIQAGRFDEAVFQLNKIIEREPENNLIQIKTADILMNQGKFSDAENKFRNILKKEPDNINVKIKLAEAFFRTGKLSESFVILEDTVKIQPKNADALLLYSRVLYKTGDIITAGEMYRKAVSINPSLEDPALEEEFTLKTGPGYDDGRVRVPAGDFDFTEDPLMEKPDIDFSVVGGMEKLKEEIRMKIIHPLNNEDLYKMYGKKIGGGILMYGPPGCGKTYLARATAGEINANFISLGLHEILDMWLGQSERNLHNIFEYARFNSPSVLFFDEVDALGASRTDMKRSAGRQLINQFLSELDGVTYSNEGVLILAATNAPWHLDSAFRRPGRFDRILFVPPPDINARAEIYKIMLKDKPLKDIDYTYLAKKSDEFSGADIKSVVDNTIENKLNEALKKGVPEPITTKDVIKSVKNTKSSIREWFLTAKNYAVYSNQSGIYNDILKYLGL